MILNVNGSIAKQKNLAALNSKKTKPVKEPKTKKKDGDK